MVGEVRRKMDHPLRDQVDFEIALDDLCKEYYDRSFSGEFSIKNIDIYIKKLEAWASRINHVKNI